MTNPLLNHMRIERLHIKLPSNGYFYNDEVNFNEQTHEIGIKPMTATDEMTISTPDALLNGESVKAVIQSCCKDVVDPLNLTMADIDVIFAAIKHASYGDGLDVSIVCPNCSKELEFILSLTNFLNNITYNEKEYSIAISKDIKVYCKPNSFKTIIAISLKSIEASNMFKNMSEDDLNDVEVAIKYSSEFKKIVNFNVNILLDGIQKIDVRDQTKTITVTERNDILAWISDIDKKTTELIKAKIDEANSVGLNKSVDFECDECNHKWKSDIDLNPVSFFTAGS